MHALYGSVLPYQPPDVTRGENPNCDHNQNKINEECKTNTDLKELQPLNILILVCFTRQYKCDFLLNWNKKKHESNTTKSYGMLLCIY